MRRAAAASQRDRQCERAFGISAEHRSGTEHLTRRRATRWGCCRSTKCSKGMADEAFAVVGDRPRYVRDGVERLQAHLRQFPKYSCVVVTPPELLVVSTNAEHASEQLKKDPALVPWTIASTAPARRQQRRAASSSARRAMGTTTAQRNAYAERRHVHDDDVCARAASPATSATINGWVNARVTHVSGGCESSGHDVGCDSVRNKIEREQSGNRSRFSRSTSTDGPCRQRADAHCRTTRLSTFTPVEVPHARHTERHAERSRDHRNRTAPTRRVRVDRRGSPSSRATPSTVSRAFWCDVPCASSRRQRRTSRGSSCATSSAGRTMATTSATSRWRFNRVTSRRIVADMREQTVDCQPDMPPEEASEGIRRRRRQSEH